MNGNSTTTNVPTMLPCNRGISGGVRGLHNFQAGMGGVICCTYCGQRGPSQEVKVTWGAPYVVRPAVVSLTSASGLKTRIYN